MTNKRLPEKYPIHEIGYGNELPVEQYFTHLFDALPSRTTNSKKNYSSKIYEHLESNGFVNECELIITGRRYDKPSNTHMFVNENDSLMVVIKSTLDKTHGLYYDLLSNTLSEGYMGTEESIFTIMVYKYPDLFNYSEIEGNGLVWLFFENLKNETLKLKSEKSENTIIEVRDLSKVGLYVIGFNSPKQFETLIFSMKRYDPNFIDKPKKYLLDNSTDLTTTEKYLWLCNEYGFEHIKKDNLGICGGRQFIAEHFNETDLEYMFFFEDDMFFYPKKGDLCRNGFNRFVNDLYNKSLKIINNENLDFLKLNFSEFYGDNSTQWSWYNVPQTVREEIWPDNKKLPVQGLDPNAPRTKFESIKSLDGVPYSIGEVYYCNWPQIVSKKGNVKMFLETKWGHPFEQTWMSYIYQETVKGKIKSGILLLTPTEHDRFDHYESSLRKES